MPVHGLRRFLSITALFAAAALSAPVSAQYVQAPNGPDPYSSSRDWSDDIPAHISFVEGSVTLEREGKLEPAEANLALLAGDRLRTKSGRVEILFADGSALYLDEGTELDLLSSALLRLMTGRVRMSIARATTDLDYRIDAPAASVWIRAAGEYRVDVRQSRRAQTEVELSVVRGSAELVNEHGRTVVRPGTYAVASPELAPSLPYVDNSADWDEFDEWVDRQRNARVGTTSTRYLPTELRYYGGAFDNYGSWDYVPTHGYVWYPRVSSGWRPYSQGRWSFSAHFGWMWVGIDRWSWATHHYGRWGVNAGAWYWIPDRRWSPAWVSWGTAPGYVSWCPLGFDGRPVYGFRHYDPWLGWTVLPSRHFTHNVWVTQHIVVPTVITPVVRQQFIERPTPPVVPAIATPRVSPIHAPTFTRATAVARNPAYRGEESWRSRATNESVLRESAERGQTIGGATARAASRTAPSQPEANAGRAVPERARGAVWGQPDVPRTEAPRTEAPRVQSPRATAPDRSTTADDVYPRATPRRAVPPSQEEPPPQLGSAGRARPDTTSRRQPQGPARTRPDSSASEPPRTTWPSQRVEAPPRAEPPQRSEPDRSPSRQPERAAPRWGGEQSRPSAPPPQRSEPDRAPSRVPDRASPRQAPPPPSAPPPSTAPPPNRGRGGGSEAQAPPPSRGGGETRAVPRRGGGGGLIAGSEDPASVQ